MGTGKLLGKSNKLRGNDLRWSSILSRGSRNTPSRFMVQKPGISSGSYGPLGSKGFIFFFASLMSTGFPIHFTLLTMLNISAKIKL